MSKEHFFKTDSRMVKSFLLIFQGDSSSTSKEMWYFSLTFQSMGLSRQRVSQTASWGLDGKLFDAKISELAR